MVLRPVRLFSIVSEKPSQIHDEEKKFTSAETTALIVKHTSAIKILRSILDGVN
jgi:hypothetical protein